MDQIDKRIIYSLLRDGRATQRQIASDIGISAQTLNYRFKKLTDDGVIKGFTLHVSPYLNNRVQGFAAFNSEKEYKGKVVMKIRCLEETTLYGFEAETIDGVLRNIRDAGNELGEPVMQYIPSVPPISMNVNSLDLNIIGLLRGDPRSSASDLASKLGIPYLTVKRRINLIFKNHLAGVITRVDLSSGDIILYLIFSNNVEKVSGILASVLVFSISDQRSGVFICFSENLKYAKENIRKVRTADPDAHVMVLYDYEIYS
ncbi:MAG: winged helix-turn-helix transcriptional regulator [Thermoplasmataceae archaeon]